MDITAALGKYIGLPFMSHGRDWSGCDCWGLVRLIYGELKGIALPSYDEEYRDTEDKDSLSRLVPETAAEWEPVPLGQEQPYDVIVLRLLGIPMHVALVAKRGRMIHVLEGADAVFEYYNSPMWRTRIIGIYRYVPDPNISPAAAV